jgi:hypothetical protein
MKMISNPVANLSLLCCLLFFVSFTAFSQSWQKFSPPDKSLVIELPTRPNLVTNKDDSPDVLFKNVRSAYSYSANLGSGSQADVGIVFGVLHLSKAIGDRSFDKTVNSNMLFIGGDDKDISKQSDVSIGGFHGREFVYDKAGIDGRAIWVNGRTRVYFLIFQDSNDKTSPETVSRIFNTFRPLR